ncbi:DUF402 domain-containing protein [Metamycoplasma equirhinis]|uniref:DUF402 domain-containing protein n=1 Tax=Metamycoplasma equirhinis TaxID=92402 RepID=A0ABZ0PAE7_9BACT|nr:DUF402 domain-containing protein [Metamycoplasma equirhinis]WPB54004.1 DUF402 domain-containing protein [Metamycoplasma equirhinis]BDX52439.1 UPF0374 protein [Metamycoplasma equirhinis]
MNEEKTITSFQDLFNEPDYSSKIQKNHRKLFEMGEITTIQAFKYDGSLYRQYEGAKIVANFDDFVVVLLIKSKVMEDNINWVVSDPILFFFAKNKFYNASITLNKRKDNYIYINLASPFFIEDGIIKYIDFDIDIKSYVDKDFNVIDWQDFKESIVKYNYSLKLIYKIYDELDFLQEQHKTKNGIFSKKLIDGLTKMLIESGDI